MNPVPICLRSLASSVRSLVALPLVAAWMFGGQVSAQCSNVWLPGEGLPGTNGVVNATTMWDPDGPGPELPKLVVAGAFTLVGNAFASNIALYDPASGAWSAMGTGMNGGVGSLTTLANGDLVAGGSFSVASGLPANNIARWDGTSWSAMGTGMNGGVGALMTLPNGDLVAGGSFSAASGLPANNIARWDGTSWSAMGTGVSGAAQFLVPYVSALTLQNGNIVAGGYFTTAGGVPANSIAQWNGTSWSAMGSGISNTLQSAIVSDMKTLPTGDVVACGSFDAAGGVWASNIARWDGTSWSSLGNGSGGSSYSRVNAMTRLLNGDLVVSGSFLPSVGALIDGIARWDGMSWSYLSPGANATGVNTLMTLPNGDLLAGGDFTTAGGVPANDIARWNWTSWSALSPGMNGAVSALATLPNGDVVAGGSFTTVGGVPANLIARWDGTNWSALGTTIDMVVRALTALPNGDLVAGGTFTAAGGVPANNISRWNGTSWSGLGAGMSNTVNALTTLSNGDVVAGGAFVTAGGITVNRIARWNGTSWSALSTGVNGGVRALTRLPNGDLVAAGLFSTAGGLSANRIARWNGTSWSALGSGMNNTVNALVTLPNGDLVAGGIFTTAGGVAASRIARWNGTSWSALGAGVNNTVNSLASLPNGDLMASGTFTTAGGVSVNGIARWSGASWSDLGSGVNGTVSAMTPLLNGDLVVGGDFTMMGTVVSAYLGRLSTTCPASTTALGAGCTGSGGLNTLTATSLPWLGSSFQVRATGFPLNSLGFALLGITPTSIPVVAVHPAGLPGCTLYTLGDVQTDFLFPSAGAANIGYSIPMDPFLVGLVAHAQMASVELDLSANITAITTTNEVQFTLGQF